jgi:hypothetical protein
MHQVTFERLLSDYAYWSINALETFDEEMDALGARVYAAIKSRGPRRVRQRATHR